MKHFSIRFEPDNRKTSVHAGATIVEAAGQVGIILETICGGEGTCGKCKVRIQPEGREVLACQHRIERDLVVSIPAQSRLFEHKILEHGIDAPSVTPTIGLEYGEKADSGRILGLAVDIGTTTVVAKLLDVMTGEVVGVKSALNPQTRFGDDVISRISHGTSQKGAAELRAAVVDCINSLTENICRERNLSADDIVEACIVGNTTMNHLFLELPVAQLGQAPYQAHSLDACDRAASESGLRMNPAGNVHSVANIAGFVGSDITAVGLALDIESSGQTTLVVDIGTNGELLLSKDGRVYAASCAAGPAFEGARIICGARAASGAIEAVVVNGEDIGIDVIGGGEARTVCGSGLIDAVAVMLELGIIDQMGRFVDVQQLQRAPEPIRRRVGLYQGKPAFYLSGSEGRSDAVFIAQEDIRQVQLAKGAIRAGIQLLQKRVGIDDEDLGAVLLAGAFGSYIRRESAVRIGLLPDVEIHKIRFVGNAAGSGAQMILLNRQSREAATRLARSIEYVEIANDAAFTDVYADAMLFPASG